MYVSVKKITEVEIEMSVLPDTTVYDMSKIWISLFQQKLHTSFNWYIYLCFMDNILSRVTAPDYYFLYEKTTVKLVKSQNIETTLSKYDQNYSETCI